ncbi:MAG: Prokaryotic Cytochrome oxidase subunit [Aeromicrobium sp.]|nr:Prokaryotic Cytochrome oxidase subunit [Aeromicrobium sp.]
MRLPVRTTSVVWLVLMAATITSTWVLSKNAFDPRVATVGVLVIAGWKVRLVIMHFMEIRTAPWAFRLVLEAWVVGVTTMLLVMYLVTN